jgi:hypothetical protein
VASAAPAGLAAAVSGSVFASSPAGLLPIFLGMTTVQTAVVTTAAIAGALAYFTGASTNAQLRGEVAALRGESALLPSLRAENQRLAAATSEAELLRAEDAEFRQLEQRVADARQAQQERTRAAQAARNQITDAQVQAEVGRMNREGNQLVVEYKGLMERARDPKISAESRELSATAAQAKMEAIQAKQREIQGYIAQNRALLGTSEMKASEPGSNAAAESASVTMSLPATDYQTALSAYERVARVKIIRDPSLDGVRGTADIQLGTAPRNQMLERLRGALREQFNIVFERGADGALTAKRIPGS